MSALTKRRVRSRRRPRPADFQGFTLVELLLAVVVTGIVAGALFGLMNVQNRGYAKVREVSDVHTTLRSTAALLGWDLKYASPRSGDLYAIRANGFDIRSFQGSAVICRKQGMGWYGLVFGDGDLRAVAESVLVFSAGGVFLSDDTWKAIRLQAVGPPSGATCAWPGSPTVEGRLQITPATPADTSGIRIGAPVRVFRPVRYGTYQWRGRWWLGRRMAGGPWEPLAGPLPDSMGLRLLYFDDAGNLTANPADVASVEMVLGAQSTYREGPAEGMKTDSVRMKVNVRG